MSAQITGAPFKFDVPVIWDPVPDADFERFEVYRAAELEIIGVNQGTKKFSIKGQISSWYQAGDEIIITGSNAGTYTVVAATEPAGLIQTDIEVAEAIPSSTIDGTLTQALIQFMAYTGKSNSFTDKLLPTGTYYYVVYAFDKVGNLSDPGNIIVKKSPFDIGAPADPTGLVAKRDSKLREVDLFWIANPETDLKGYGVLRSFDGISYDIIAFTTKNSFVDKNIPLHEDLDSNTTPVIYSIFAYDKSFFISGGSALSDVLEMPTIVGIKGVIDYLSINVSWTKPLPEELDDPNNTEFDIYLWTMLNPTPVLQGTVKYPISIFTIDGPLAKDATYMVGVNIRPFTGSTAFMQPEPIPITIPDYTQDLIPPNAPVLEVAEPDPQNDRILLSWMRHRVDDDLLYYDVKWSSKWDVNAIIIVLNEIAILGDMREFFKVGDTILWEGATEGKDGEYTVKSTFWASGPGRTEIELEETIPGTTADGTIKNFITYMTTKQNETVFRNPKRSRTYGAPGYEMYFRVDAVDRSDNKTQGEQEEVKLVSQDWSPPQWYDQYQFTPNTPAAGPPQVFAGNRWTIMWDDAAQFMKYFRRYLIYESINWNGTYPVFAFGDHELRGTSFDNIFTIYNYPIQRGSTHASKIGKKWIVITVEDWFGDVKVYQPGGTPNYSWFELTE